MLSDKSHSPFAGSTPFLTFGELGETAIPLSDVCSSLKELPLDGVIGFLATLSWTIAKEGTKTADPTWQAFYLNMALVDDFPRTPRRLSHYLMPGRVPSTGTSNVFIHNQNLAILAHLAVIHCSSSSFTPRFEEALKQRVCRLLLLINDLLNEPVPQTSSPTLMQRKEFCLRWLRLHQFGLETPFFTRAAHNIARQSKLYSLVQEHGRYDVEGKFLAASQGVSLYETFQLLAVLISTVYLKLGGRA